METDNLFEETMKKVKEKEKTKKTVEKSLQGIFNIAIRSSIIFWLWPVMFSIFPFLEGNVASHISYWQALGLILFLRILRIAVRK